MCCSRSNETIRSAFAKPIRSGIREIVVNGPKEAHVVSLEDVGGRSLHVRKSSDHYTSLLRLNEQLKKIASPASSGRCCTRVSDR